MLLSNLWNHISKTYGTDKEIIMVSMGWFYELRIVSHFGTKDRKKGKIEYILGVLSVKATKKPAHAQL